LARSSIILLIYCAPMFSVGDVVRKLRLLRDWTIEDLARRGHLNKMTVSAIERGHNHQRASLDAVGRALGVGDASGLEVTLREWTSAVAAPTAVSADVREWLEIHDGLKRDPEALRDMVRFLLRRYVRDVFALRGNPERGARSASGTRGSSRTSAPGAHR
jgi:transcriptional regulator with XRE-family HTH domain